MKICFNVYCLFPDENTHKFSIYLRQKYMRPETLANVRKTHMRTKIDPLRSESRMNVVTEMQQMANVKFR